ncbi:RNA polymerase sigma factor [Marisediminicola senii]|uniref:RNA polymerase sigma factor n=1 Tax=Marisediminicola senii TaxID=2711233 RepID=UPI0013EDEEF1|nr:sigma-70 family RNA polymerase sigma factor [Marisediminicola senii]
MTRPAWEGVVAELIEHRGRALTAYATMLCGNVDDAADLVQEALVKTFGRLSNGYTVTSAEAYVRRAILNTHLDGTRRAIRWRRIAHLQAAPTEAASPATATDARLDMHHMLGTLAPRERACIVLRYYDDLKVDDIATELGLSAGAVKRYLSDGLAKMAIETHRDDPSEGDHARPPAASETAATRAARGTNTAPNRPTTHGGSHAHRS